jgi:hypothetical protein
MRYIKSIITDDGCDVGISDGTCVGVYKIQEGSFFEILVMQTKFRRLG